MESTSIYAALAAVQSELKAPKGQMNTFGGYRYRSCEDILEAVKPILKAHDLLLTLSDEPKVLEGWHYIEATAKLESLDGGCISVKAYAREPEQKTKISAGTIARTACLLLALTNQVLSALGKPVLPIESQTVEQLVTAGITTVAALVAWWKNNSFTPAALQADQTYDKLKAQGK